METTSETVTETETETEVKGHSPPQDAGMPRISKNPQTNQILEISST